MQDDTRCCGTGTCLINAEGFCWCGQQWDGSKMCFAAQQVVVHVAASERLHGAPSDAMPLAEKPER